MMKMKPKEKMTTVLLPKPLWLAAKRHALLEDKSLRAIIREALAAHLKASGKAVSR